MIVRLHSTALDCAAKSHCFFGLHDDVIKWNQFPRYWPFVRGIHQWPVNSPHKGRWRGAFMFFFICAWTNGWVNYREGDLRRHRAHYDVTVMDDAPYRVNPTLVTAMPCAISYNHKSQLMFKTSTAPKYTYMLLKLYEAKRRLFFWQRHYQCVSMAMLVFSCRASIISGYITR